MKQFNISALFLVGLAAVFSGCGTSTDTGSYRQFKDLSDADPHPLQNPVPEFAASPAIAEKPDRPAIAQAAPSRPESNAQTVAGSADSKADEIKLLIPEKRIPKAKSDGTLQLTYDDLDLLKVLNMKEVPLDFMDYLPAWLENLDGKRVRIRGFMMPAFQAEGLRGFTLARDNEICCFTREAKLYDLIAVRMRDGLTTKYLQQVPFDVEGTFHITPPEEDDDVLLQIYEIRDAKVITLR